MAAKLLFIFFIVLSDVIALKLTQVLLLGRHNIRTPLTESLEKVTPNVWPKWEKEVGYLTEKGATLEGYFGDFYSSWLRKEDLFDDGCPDEESVYIYANVRQRTMETAKHFAESAFKNCNITVNFKKNVTNDPIFHPAVRNSTEAFKKTVFHEMRKKLDSLKLKNVYRELNNILDLNNSRVCKESSICDLTAAKDKIIFEVGEEPNVEGPLSIGNSVVDAFLMAYYNGASPEEIGWGKIGENSWESLTKVTKENQNVRFNSTSLALDVAAPLLNKMKTILQNPDLKFAMLVGHDSNLNSVISAMSFKPFDLVDQYEETPIGGKVVFEKWYDAITDEHLLKINYVYQTTDQLRRGVRLSLETPPRFVTMELKHCKVDENGYCSWNRFMDLMQKLQQVL